MEVGEVATEAVGLRLHLSVAPGTRACVYHNWGLYICRQKVGDKMVPSEPSFDTDRGAGGGGGSRHEGGGRVRAAAGAVGEYPLAVTEAEGMQLHLSSRSSPPVTKNERTPNAKA